MAIADIRVRYDQQVREDRFARAGARWGGVARRRWLGGALIGCGAAMVPWLVVLADTLPATARVPHWSTAWVGLDALEALGLASTGLMVLRRDPRRCLPAAATAALLVVDAWFDVTTSRPGPELATAITMALCAELPMAALCTVLAVRALPSGIGDGAADGAADPDGSGVRADTAS